MTMTTRITMLMQPLKSRAVPTNAMPKAIQPLRSLDLRPSRSWKRQSLLLASLCLTLFLSTTGCAERFVRHQVIQNNQIEADLVRTVKGLTVKPRTFEHPAIISVPRLINILNAIEVETPAKDGGDIRQPAFHPEIVERTAKALAKALAEASPNEEVGISAIRKEMRLGVFHTKYLTSFLARIENDNLYIDLDRVEWRIPQEDENQRGKQGAKLPKPRHDRPPMRFRVVHGEHLYFAGSQMLEIDWQNNVFSQAYALPGTTKGSPKKREILLQAPVPKEERDAMNAASGKLEDLSSDQLRALADLEDDRRAGKITETDYQRARRALLRER